jgi:Histone methylation protein DOT1
VKNPKVKLPSALSAWWGEQRQRSSPWVTLRSLGAITCEFIRESMPDRQRQRFGNADYDWTHRVDTTSGNVSAKVRFIGLLTSSYQPIEPELFQEMLNALGVDYSQFTFVDVGSGKGRALLMASEYPFKRVIGLELLSELDAIAQENIRTFPKECRRCQAVESIQTDATRFVFPIAPLIVFIFHSLPEAGFRTVMGNLQLSIGVEPRPVRLIYANPVFESILAEFPVLKKTAGTHQYSIFEAN